METYRLKVSPITPIHIGSGEELEAYEYIITDKLHRLNLNRFLDLISNQDKKTRMLKLMEKNILELREFLKKEFEGNREIRENAVEYTILISELTKKFYDQKIDDPQNVLTVKLFQRNRLGPYVPGSSVKGAIRTAILYNEINTKEMKYSKPDVRDKKALRTFEQKILNYQDPQSDPLRAVKITDSLSPFETIIATVSITTLRGGRWETDKYKILSEVSLSEFEIEVRIDTELQNNLEEKVPNFCKFSIEDVINACRNFYFSHFERERDRLRGSRVEEKYEYIKKKILKIKDKNHSFPLRFGWGSGFDAVTLNSVLPGYQKKKSTKLVENLPLGWVEVSLTKE